MAKKRWGTTRKEFGFIVSKAREARNLSQGEVAEAIQQLIGEKGHYSQKKISRLESGEIVKYLPADEVAALAQVLELTEDQQQLALSPKQENPPLWISVREDGYLLSLAKQQEFQPYFGVYHGIFRSTDSDKAHFNRTKLEVFPASDGLCRARMEILDKSGTAIKNYEGVFFINTNFRTCYFVLSGQVWQEISLMIAPYFAPAVKGVPNKFIVAQVLTSSAGAHKQRTVAHRMVLSRKLLQGEQFELACSQLQLNTDSIFISPEQLEKLRFIVEERLEEDPKSNFYHAVRKACDIIDQDGQKIAVLRIEESKLYDEKQLGLSREGRALVTAMLREYSENVYYNKISETVLELIEAIIDWPEEKGWP